MLSLKNYLFMNYTSLNSAWLHVKCQLGDRRRAIERVKQVLPAFRALDWLAGSSCLVSTLVEEDLDEAAHGCLQAIHRNR